MRALVLDLFHTLVDPDRFRPVGYDRVTATARFLGVDEAAFARRWRELEEPRTRGLTPPNTELFADASGRDPDDPVVLEAAERYGRELDECLRRPDPSTKLALDAMRRQGLRIGLLSNAECRDVEALDDSPLAERLDAAVISCDVHLIKPQAAMYEAILELLDVPAEQAAFVGDGGSDELAGAKQVGFGLVARTREYVDRGPGGEDVVLDRLGQILDHL